MAEYVKNFFNRRVSPRFFVFVYDTLLIMLSFLVASFFHYGLSGMADKLTTSTFIIVSTVVIVNWGTFYLFKTFWGVLRFSAFSDITRVVGALSIGYLVSLLILISGRELGFISYLSYTVFFGSYVLNTMLMSLSRVVVKEIYDATIIKPKRAVRTMKIGRAHV